MSEDCRPGTRQPIETSDPTTGKAHGVMSRSQTGHVPSIEARPALEGHGGPAHAYRLRRNWAIAPCCASAIRPSSVNWWSSRHSGLTIRTSVQPASRQWAAALLGGDPVHSSAPNRPSLSSH